MNQRLVIAILFLVLTLVVLALAGMGSTTRADGATTVRPLLPGTMSGEFAPTHFACADNLSPSIGGRTTV